MLLEAVEVGSSWLELLGAYVRRALIGRQNGSLDERAGTEKRESPRQVWPSPASPDQIMHPCPSMVSQHGATHLNSSFGDPSLLGVIHTPKSPPVQHVG